MGPAPTSTPKFCQHSLPRLKFATRMMTAYLELVLELLLHVHLLVHCLLHQDLLLPLVLCRCVCFKRLLLPVCWHLQQ